MARIADNFDQFMTRVWARGDDADAVEIAERRGGELVFPVRHKEVWSERKDDSPAYLVVFPDGSDYVVAQDGSWVAAARRRGSQTVNYVPI